MASNPATAFNPAMVDPFTGTLPPMEPAPEDIAMPAQRLPDNGVGNMPGIGGGFMDDLQRQAVQQALQTLQEPKPKAKFTDKLKTYGALLGAPTGPEKDWQDRQNQAMRLLTASGQLGGMTRNAIALGNLGMRGIGLEQSAARLGQSAQRLTLAQAEQDYKQRGLTTFHNNEYNPETGRNETAIYGMAHDPNSGQEFVVSKQFVAEAPLTFSQPIEVAGGGTVQTTLQPTSSAPPPSAAPVITAPSVPTQTADTAHSAAHPAGVEAIPVGVTPSSANSAPKASPHSAKTPHPSVIPSPITKQPPPGAALQFGDKLRFVQSLEGIAQLHDEAQKSVANGPLGSLGLVGQIASDKLSDTKYGRAFVGDPEVAFKQGIKWAIYQYVKQQTGAQFSIQEMDRYDRMFPTLADSPERTRILIRQAVNAVSLGIRNMQAQWGGLRAPGYTPEMQAAEDTPPPELDALTGGGKKSLDQMFDEHVKSKGR